MDRRSGLLLKSFPSTWIAFEKLKLKTLLRRLHLDLSLLLLMWRFPMNFRLFRKQGFLLMSKKRPPLRLLRRHLPLLGIPNSNTLPLYQLVRSLHLRRCSIFVPPSPDCLLSQLPNSIQYLIHLSPTLPIQSMDSFLFKD